MKMSAVKRHVQRIFFCILTLATFPRVQSAAEPSATPMATGTAEQPPQEEIVMAIIVDPGRLECVFQPIAAQKYVSFEMDYQVIEGGDNDITFTMKSPNGVLIASDVRKTEGTHRVTLDESQNGRGDYALCFDNSFSYTSAKRVFFELFLLDKDGNYLNNYDLKTLNMHQASNSGLLAEQLETFNRVTNKVKGNLNEVERVQAQFRAIEARDRSSIETAFERINFWSIAHLCCLVFAGSFQVFLLRSLFIDDSRVGQLVRHGRFK